MLLTFTPNQAVTLTDLTIYRAQNQPQQLAYHFLENGEEVAQTVSYSELDQQARSIAAWLQAHHSQGARALLLYQSSLDYVAAFLGCLYAGVIAVPAYPPHPKRPITRIKTIIDDAQATFALTTSDALSALQTRFEDEPQLENLNWLATDTVDTALGDVWIQPDIDENTLAFLQYTSGSTSTPKGVMVTHGNLLYTLEDLHRGWNHTAESVMVTWLPIFHDLGLIYGILTPLYRGFTCYLMSPLAFLQKPVRWLQAISNFGGTHTAAPNFAYELCIRKITTTERDKLDLTSWQMGLNAAEPVRLDTFERFVNKFAPAGFRADTFSTGYGLAEASVKVAAERIEADPIFYHLDPDALEDHRVVLDAGGIPIAGSGWSEIGADIRIVNPDTCEPTDGVGEIWVNSGSVAQGYWNRPKTTAETFQATITGADDKPFMRTGDLGFIRDDNLFITGRIKDLLIIRGRNLYPHDIERTIEQAHPAIRPGRVAAFSAPVDNEERLIVVMEPRPKLGDGIDSEMLFAALRRAIAVAHDVQPYELLILKPGGVLKTSNGKIQRQACKRAYLASKLPVLGKWRNVWTESAETITNPLDSPPTQTEIANWLTLWFANHLVISPSAIDHQSPFADYGIESMTAVELITSLKSWLRHDIDLTAAWDFPTIETLSAYLAQIADTPLVEVAESADSTDDEDNLTDDEILALLQEEVAQSMRLLD